MTTAERKIRLATTILNEADEFTLDELEFMLYPSKPSAEEIEEIKRRLERAEEEFNAGGGIPHEQVVAHFENIFRNARQQTE